MLQNFKKNWREGAAWKQMKGIPFEDCVKAKGTMQPGEPLRKKSSSGPIVGFGKHKHLTYKELKEQQPYYFKWACAEIEGFKEKAEKYL